MVDYHTLVENVLKTLQEVSIFSPGKIDMILKEESDVGDEVLEKWKRLTSDVCYDRKYCKLLGVKDYNNLHGDDVQRIKAFTLYLIRNNPDIVLPVL